MQQANTSLSHLVVEPTAVVLGLCPLQPSVRGILVVGVAGNEGIKIPPQVWKDIGQQELAVIEVQCEKRLQDGGISDLVKICGIEVMEDVMNWGDGMDLIDRLFVGPAWEVGGYGSACLLVILRLEM